MEYGGSTPFSTARVQVSEVLPSLTVGLCDPGPRSALMPSPYVAVARLRRRGGRRSRDPNFWHRRERRQAAVDHIDRRIPCDQETGFAGMPIVALACMLACIRPSPAAGYDIVIRNGRIIDGTGSPWYSGDVGIRDGKIASIGNLATADSRRVLDARGMVVAPGFIDMLRSVRANYPGKRAPSVENISGHYHRVYWRGWITCTSQRCDQKG